MTMHCAAQHLGPHKNGGTNPDAVSNDEWAWLEEQCVVGVTIPKGEGAILGKIYARQA